MKTSLKKRLYDKAYKEAKKEQLREYNRQYNLRNKDKIKAWRIANYDRVVRREALYREKNKEQRNLSGQLWRKKNKNRINANTAKRRAAKLKRTPSYANLEAIKAFYQNCPKGMVVDHIIPLQGEIISGFHVLENLQYLTPEENARKGNKFPYYPIEFYANSKRLFSNHLVL